MKGTAAVFEAPREAFAIWLTGLPASGKSSIARELAPRLEALGWTPEVLESDAVRRLVTPAPSYSEGERELFYRALAFAGSRLVAHGVAVIFDATAHRRSYREFARGLIPRFFEVLVECSLETCRGRDPKGIYRQAEARGSGSVPGLQVEFEPPLDPAVVVTTERESPSEAAERIIAMLVARQIVDRRVGQARAKRERTG